MYSIIKRDGKVVEFDVKKISSAITKAFKAVDREYHASIIDMLALRTCADFESKVKDGKIAVEDVQDSVEKVLSDANYADVAKAYILYRKQREKARNLSASMLDYKDLLNSYAGSSSESNDEAHSIGDLILSNSRSITTNYWLSEIYDEEISQSHLSGVIYIQDLNRLTPSISNWSLDKLIKEGLSGNSISSNPSKHFNTLLRQIVEYLEVMQNEWASIQSINNFDTYLAPFVKEDKLSYKEVKDYLEGFIYSLNAPIILGSAPSTSLILDTSVPKELVNKKCILGGKELSYTYNDCQKEVDLINKALLEVMLEGDSTHHKFKYPKLIYVLHKDFDWSNELLFNLVSKDSSPIFTLDSSLSKGVIGEVTINLPRIAYNAKTIEDFYKRLDKVIEVATRSLHMKKEVVTKLLDNGLYPYTKKYLGSYDNYESIISVIGVNEMCLNAKWLNESLLDENALSFSKEVIKHINDVLTTQSEKQGDTFKLLTTSSIDASHKLASLDKENLPGVITSLEDEVPYYEVSSNITDDLFEQLDIEDTLNIPCAINAPFVI